IETEIVIEPQLTAPVAKGQKVGYVNFILNGQTVKTCEIVASEDVDRAGFLDYFSQIFGGLF
ncbi:MAG: serine-type D-Ala-D-Ala carboxypeptidase, partial [Eubacteriales bacterium]